MHFLPEGVRSHECSSVERRILLQGTQSQRGDAHHKGKCTEFVTVQYTVQYNSI